jgi:hypothetical protein
MGSEYDPLFAGGGEVEPGDLERVRREFAAASRPHFYSPWPWLAWGLILPATALATSNTLAHAGAPGALLLWSGAILVGGAVELAALLRGRRGLPRSALTTWVMRGQGNLSLVAVALSGLLLWEELGWALPALWLLLLGHSLYSLGGLAFPPLRTAGLLYQLGGAMALWPGGEPLWVFAAATATGNLWVALAILRRGLEEEVPADELASRGE